MSEHQCRYSGCKRCFDTIQGRNSHEGLAHDGNSPLCPEKEKLEKMYRKMSTSEIAEKIGVSRSCVTFWMADYNIERRSRDHHLVRMAPTITVDGKGYERIIVQEDGSNSSFRVHQLLAIANGENPYKVFSGDYSVHHKSKIPWDNRPENITLLTRSEHQLTHAKSSFS